MTTPGESLTAWNRPHKIALSICKALFTTIALHLVSALIHQQRLPVDEYVKDVPSSSGNLSPDTVTLGPSFNRAP